MKFDDTEQLQRLLKLKIEALTMLNFILAAAIVAAGILGVYSLGLLIWG